MAIAMGVLTVQPAAASIWWWGIGRVVGRTRCRNCCSVMDCAPGRPDLLCAVVAVVSRPLRPLLTVDHRAMAGKRFGFC